MAAVVDATSDLLSIRPFKTSWRIKVKIIHSWKPNTVFSGDTIEMVLADVSGTLIHATLKRPQFGKFQRLIIPGQWLIIETFSLSKAVGKYRVTNHVYRMSLINTTSIFPCASLSSDIFLKLVDFEAIRDDTTLNENILVDVVGQVVNVGELKIHQVKEKDKKKVEFELRDIRDVRLSCTLWDVFAERILAACENNGQTMVICLLRFAKINSFKGQRSVSNAYDISLMEINPDLPKIVEFREQLPKDGLALTIKEAVPKEEKAVSKAEFYKHFERRTIAEVIEYNEEAKFKIFGSIYAIDMEFAWYYFSCLKCTATVFKVPKVENEVVKKNKQTLFWCGGCNESHTKVEPRYRLTVCVMDSTSQIKCLLLEKDARMILQKSSLQLLDGHFDEIQDPTNIPKELRSLVGKTFQFVVTIGKDNIRDGSDVYKVAHVCVGLNIDQEDSIEQSQGLDDLTTSLSFDQGTMVLSNSCEQNDASATPSTTPSSKRKDDVSGESSDQSSSSKKLCVGSIKGALEDAHVASG